MTAKIHIVHYGLQNSLTCIISFGLYVSGDRYIFYDICYKFIGNKPDKYKLKINFST